MSNTDIIDEPLLDIIMWDVEADWWIPGLSHGLYADWAKEVLRRYLQRTARPEVSDIAAINPNDVGDATASTIPVLHQGIVSEIWGKWPGDETIDQILNALKEPKPVQLHPTPNDQSDTIT